jgi:DNA-binding transcriptional ArsR family regulator
VAVPASVALVDRPDRVREVLSPIRLTLLHRLRTPSSASQLASGLGLGRQRVNYHLRALERAGFIELVEERQRRGCVERMLVARARAFVVDPEVVGAGGGARGQAEAQDRFSAEHLIHSAASVVRHVSRMQAAADREGTRLLTFTIDTELTFDAPADLERFTTALAAFIAQHAARHAAVAGRRYRIVAGGHPAPAPSSTLPAGAPHEHVRSRPRRNRRRGPH